MQSTYRDFERKSRLLVLIFTRHIKIPTHYSTIVWHCHCCVVLNSWDLKNLKYSKPRTFDMVPMARQLFSISFPMTLHTFNFKTISWHLINKITTCKVRITRVPSQCLKNKSNYTTWIYTSTALYVLKLFTELWLGFDSLWYLTMITSLWHCKLVLHPTLM